MRPSTLFFAALLLLTGLALQFSSQIPPETAGAQESVANAPADALRARELPDVPPRTPNPYALPDLAETTSLVAFVQTLSGLRPEPGAAQDDYDLRAPVAIRSACERILELERSPASAAHQFARRELLIFRIQDLAAPDAPDSAECRRIADDVVTILRASKRTAADVELATTLATTFEEFAPVSHATDLYRSLGDLFVRSVDERIARRGEFLLGAARRLEVIGQPLELSGQRVDGQPLDPALVTGKYVLVSFWATWCGHCQDEIPNLRRAYQTYHDLGFEIVGISLDEDRDQLQEYLTRHNLPWPILHDAALGSEHPLATHYGITAYPTTFLLDRRGRVVATDLRGRKLTRKLQELCGRVENQRRTFPVFHIDDVVSTLTTAATRLHRSKKTTSDAQLRPQLQRATTTLDLPETSDEVLSDRELYRRACDSVFVICSLYRQADGDWQTSLATAFAVTRDGVLATSCHVFDNDDHADAVVVMNRHGKVFPVTELLAANRKADTCLFRIDATDLTPLPLGDEAPPGTRVRVLGHPGDSFYYFTDGVIANYERDSDGVTWLNTTADFGQGSSGGPVMDGCGNVVGQVSRTYTLYAGGVTRGRRRMAETPARPPEAVPDADKDVADPQMVFKSSVPVKVLRALVKARD